MQKEYIYEHANHDDATGDMTLDPEVKGTMVDFLLALRNNKFAGDGLKQMCIAMEIISGYDDESAFAGWFSHCIPLLWV
jgi:hypothetical protein